MHVIVLSSHPGTLAMAVHDCSTAASPLECRLDAILHALYLVAGVLAVVLIVAIVVAVRVSRRKKSDRSSVL